MYKNLRILIDNEKFDILGDGEVDRVLNELENKKFIKIFNKHYNKKEVSRNSASQKVVENYIPIKEYLYLPVDKIRLIILEEPEKGQP